MKKGTLEREIGVAILFSVLAIPTMILSHEIGHYLSALLYGVHGYIYYDWTTLTGYFQPDFNVNWVVDYCGGLIPSLIFIPFIFNKNLFIKSISVIIVLSEMGCAVYEGYFNQLYQGLMFMTINGLTMSLIGVVILVYLTKIKRSQVVLN